MYETENIQQYFNAKKPVAVASSKEKLTQNYGIKIN